MALQLTSFVGRPSASLWRAQQNADTLTDILEVLMSIEMMKTETNVQQAIPFFWVRDVKASVRFYTDGLGFRMTKHWKPEGELHWCWLELGNAAIMLQEFWTEGPDRNVPDGQVGIGVSVCFQCLNALELYKAFQTRGIETRRPFVGNNMWVLSVTDPDGYQLSFQSPTDAPEETEYIEGDA